MKIVLSGGGTGGHTMPLIAVADELLKADNSIELVAIAEKTAQAKPLREDIMTRYIYSGKYRRYYGETWSERLRDWQTVLFNIRDIGKVTVGFFQSLWLLQREQPDLIFIKGGYVSLPLGFAARLLGVSYVTHDSDTVPGLTNRLLASGAERNLVAFPVENYSYDKQKLLQTGLPVRQMFENVERTQARLKLGLEPSGRRLVIIGGSSGARQINLAAASVSKQLGQLASVLHITGKGEQYQLTEAAYTAGDNYQLREFVYDDLALELAAADVVVTRAGATALAELAALSATAVVVPHPLLTDAHQLKNAQAVNSYDAGIIVDQALLESDPAFLLATVDELLSDTKRRTWLGNNLHQMFKPAAATATAEVLRDVAQR